MDLAQLTNKRAKMTFDLDGETVSAEFYPHKLTPEYRAQLQQIARGDDDGTNGNGRDTDAQMIAELLADWDVTANNEPYPPTYENLVKAPQTLITRTALEILDVVGKLATPKPSRR